MITEILSGAAVLVTAWSTYRSKKLELDYKERADAHTLEIDIIKTMLDGQRQELDQTRENLKLCYETVQANLITIRTILESRNDVQN